MYSLDPQMAYAYTVGGIVVSAAPFVLALWAGVGFPSVIPCPCWLPRLRFSALIVFLFGRQMTSKTLQGARTRIAVSWISRIHDRVDAYQTQAHAAQYI